MLYRMINRPSTRNERRYIVFDGDVDALWIENMVDLLHRERESEGRLELSQSSV